MLLQMFLLYLWQVGWTGGEIFFAIVAKFVKQLVIFLSLFRVNWPRNVKPLNRFKEEWRFQSLLWNHSVLTYKIWSTPGVACRTAVWMWAYSLFIATNFALMCRHFLCLIRPGLKHWNKSRCHNTSLEVKKVTEWKEIISKLHVLTECDI